MNPRRLCFTLEFLLAIGTGWVVFDAVLATPIGLAIFRVGERHAKRHGKLKRSG